MLRTSSLKGLYRALYGECGAWFGTTPTLNQESDLIMNITKMEKKVAKKEMKKALKKLNQLNAVPDMPVEPLEILDTIAKREAPITPYVPFTPEEKDQFQRRIKNEKQNVWRICRGDAARIKKYCEDNASDEKKNAAVRFARRDALNYALSELAPTTAPF
jgi:hypothetical protein